MTLLFSFFRRDSLLKDSRERNETEDESHEGNFLYTNNKNLTLTGSAISDDNEWEESLDESEGYTLILNLLLLSY